MLFNINDAADTEVVRIYVERMKQNNKIIGLTSGCFDVIHFHHSLYLMRCRRECDVLIVGVDSDKLVRSTKGEHRPIIYDSRRATMIDNQKQVAFTFIMNSLEDFGRAAQFFRPEIVFKNNKFEGKEDEIAGKEHVKKIVIVKDLIEHKSTTEILEEVARRVHAKS